jgi:2,5-diketo-D-gluconate reductase B
MQLKTKSGKSVFPIGIGTWGMSSRINPDNLGSRYRGVEPVHGKEESEIEAIRYSLSKGQNHLDCAELYGGFYTDEVVGRALYGAEREDIFVADKLWRVSVDKGLVWPTVEKMLAKLGTNYLDLLYIHAPWPDYPWREAIPQICDLIDEGTVRHFGVSNFSIEDMKEAAKLSRHPIAANQMNYNVLHQDEVGKGFHRYCAENEIHIVAYQPFKRREVLEDRAVINMAKKHGASPAQVALAWLIKMGAIPIPKSASKAHIDENLGAMTVELTDEDVTILSRRG